MNLDLANRVAVVTGGSSGIGLETARCLLAEGARVAICARGEARLEVARTELARDHADRVHAVRCDVLDPADVERMRDSVMDRFDRIDILVNNAGQGRQSTFATTSDADWEAELSLKFFSVIRPTRAFLPHLQEGDAPAIVIVNSVQARQPQPHMVATAAARAGVQSLIKSMSVEFAPRVRVNAVLVGIIDSGQWERHWREEGAPGQSKEDYMAETARKRGVPLARIGLPEEPARAILFLASPAASYITGASLEVSGGISRFA